MAPNGNATNANPTQDVSESNAPVLNATGMTGMHQPSSFTANPGDLRGIATLIGISDPQQIEMIFSLCNTPIAELHQRKIPQAIINTIEANRLVLQAILVSPQAFREAIIQHTGANGALDPIRTSNDVGQHDALPNDEHPVSPDQHRSAQSHPMPSGGVSNGQSGGSKQEQIKIVPKPDVPIQNGRYPTEAELQQARQYVEMLQQEYTERIHRMGVQNVTGEQKHEYEVLYYLAWCYTTLVEPKLHAYACAYSDSVMRRLTAVALTVQHQKELADVGQPRYLINLENLRHIFSTMRVAAEQFPYPMFVTT